MAETIVSPQQDFNQQSLGQGLANGKAGATILICDDHADIVELLCSVLELEGLTTVAAYCGTDALNAVQQQHIDLVLLDKAMPDIDGFEVCRQIKAMFPSRFLPVILVTAKAHKQDKLEGLNLGADDYITKPFDLDEVLAKVRVMLRIKRVEDQLLQRNVALASFNAVASVIGESLILERMLHNSLSEIMHVMDLPCGWVFLQNDADDSQPAAVSGAEAAERTEPDGSGVHLVAHLGAEQEGSFVDIESMMRRPLAGETVSTAQPRLWLDAAFTESHKIMSCVAIPLKSKGRVLGVMALASHGMETFLPPTPAIQVLESLGFELGIAIEHALLYRDAQRTVDRLREIDALKSHFISTASHEFRTPLSIIKGFANLLTRKEDFGFDRETEQQYLSLIDGQINALTGLVEDMLSASRIESGHVQIDAVDINLADLIDRTGTPMALQAQDRAITIRIDAEKDLLVRADAGHIEQVVSNLLSNAVKYSEDGTHISVHAYRSGDDAQVDVKDQGVGISPEQLPQLFGRFSRLENARSVEAGGTGLGLYIAKNWIEANGGRIWATSDEGGSTFSFTLPAAPRQGP